MAQFGKYERAEDIPPEERKYYYLGDKFRPLHEIEWVDITFNRRWPVRIPKFLHDYHDWWDFWEKECHDSMAEHLKAGMLLYDIGAFDGWQSAVFSQMVGGPENMVLIEPVPEMWANTRETWGQNNLFPPRASFCGFADDHFTPRAMVTFHGWPPGIDYSQIIKAIKFRNIHEHYASTESTTVDLLTQPTMVPQALHIDVEGAGLKVLKGAYHTLKNHSPLVWIAIHPEFMRQRYETEPEQLHDYMDSLGYKGTLLAIDHEEHWFFKPKVSP
jgi:FkbM family methyltransferase